MKKLPYLLLLVCLAGCPAAPPKPPAKPLESKRSDARRVGLELLRQAPDTTHCWEGLQLLNAELAQHPNQQATLTPSDAVRAELQRSVGLSDGEVREVASPTYQHADAYHVAECLLLRDAAHALDVNGASPEEVAGLAFSWVQRHVLLYEQGDDWLPPAAVLRRGYGSRADRARVLLALLRQLEMEGGIVVLPDAPDDIRLLAVQPMSLTTPSVFLFDARAGRALQTADGKIATLKDVQADPKLLRPAGLTAEQFRAAEVRVACPLEALSLRMADLEMKLKAHGPISLHLNPTTLLSRLKDAAGLPVRVWNTPPSGQRLANSPTRALRQFLPPEEGGVDKTERQKRFQADLLPWTTMLLALDRLGLGQQLSAKEQQPLLLILQELLEKYDLQPRQMLLHGKGEEVVQRYERLRTFLEDESLTALAENAGFARAVAAWRDKLHTAYLALTAKEPQAQGLVNNLWAEDQYLLTLLHVEGEDRLAMALGRGEERMAPPPKTVVTSIVAYVARDYLLQRAHWMRAQVWHDRAEREQVRARHAPAGNARATSRSAWLNTRSAWNLFLDRAAAGPAARQQRVETIQALLKRSDERRSLYAAHLIERLHLELHQHYAGRINLARALHFADGAKAALAQLTSVDEELGALLEKGKGGEPGFKGEVDEVLQSLRGAGRPTAVRSLELVQHDWTPEGHFYWLRERVRAEMKALQR